MGGVFSTTIQNPSDTPNSNFSSSAQFQDSILTSNPNKSEISNQSDSSTQTLESESTKALESESTKTLESDSESSKTLDSESSKTLESKNDPEIEVEEEEGECGLCLYMKGGDCKDTFIAWENCGDEAKKNNEDIAEKCLEFTDSLLKCMEVHSDYYGPFLNSMKAAAEVALKELEKENASINSEQNGILKDSKQND